MDSNNIPYQDVNVAQDKAGRDEMVQKTGQLAVPVISINGDIVVGFDEAQLREKLGL